MRLAVLADIHGNLAAFEAVLEHVWKQDVDQIVIAGDIVNCGPDSAACWSLALSLGCPMVRGNHESYVAGVGRPGFMPELQSERFAPVRWTARQFTEAERAALGTLPSSVCLSGAPDLRIVHASPRSEFDGVTPFTPERELQEMFCGASEPCIVRAHNHMCFDRWTGGRHIISIGSVGLPLTVSQEAQCAIVERTDGSWRALHQSVPYDVDRVLERFRSSGCQEGSGPMGRLLMRELATATQQMVPFLRHYERWSEAGELSLDEAVTRFLNAY